MTKEMYLKKLLKARKVNNCSKNKQTAAPSKYPQGYFKNKKCRKCGCVFSPSAPSEHYCSDSCKDYGLVECYYVRVYGITINEYLQLAEEHNYECAICGRENFAMGTNHSGCLVVDHNHTTGKVRGLLCHNCNRAIGLLHDSVSNIENALTYLKCNDYPEREQSQATRSGVNTKVL